MDPQHHVGFQGNSLKGNSNSTPDNSGDLISHLALDIGGSLIKLVYFSRKSDIAGDDKGQGKKAATARDIKAIPNGDISNSLHGRLNFAKFETSEINDCIQFISSKKLHLGENYGLKLIGASDGSSKYIRLSTNQFRLCCQQHKAPTSDKIIVKATGGGAHKYSDLFKEKLGICLDKEDEMDSLVAGANFLLKAVHREAFTYINGQKEYVQINNDLYPYLLVNIGSGVSMIKVDGDDKFERVSGTNVGGGTFWGLGKLLTKCKSFDELLELSHRGNNRVIDMLVGDIYGGTDYTKVGLTSTTIASSFGKAISDNKELEDYKPEDVSRSLLRMISNNIGQIAYLNALRFGLKRIFFGGFFIRGQSYTMDTLSVAVHFWSKGEAKAMFLRHEGFLGAMGAFMSYEKDGLNDSMERQIVQRLPFSTSYTADKMQCHQHGELDEDESIECRVCVD